MANTILDTRKIVDWESFHSVSAEAFGFPDFYGRNMNAFIDCLSYLGENDGMTRFELAVDESLIVSLPEFGAFQATTPQIAQDFLDCIAFVNDRLQKSGAKTRVLLELL